MSKSGIKKSAMECAASHLANRMHTVYEVRKHLKDKEYDQTEIDECVAELIGLKYLDDYLYAMRYYEYSYEKKRGSRRAMKELEDKGVDKETIRNAYEDFLYENKVDEFEIAMEIARRDIYVSSDRFGDERAVMGDSDDCETDCEAENGLQKREVDDRLIAGIARKLENRGFSYDVIHRVIESVRGLD